MTSLLTFKIRSKRRDSLPFDPHGFESIGSVLRRMRLMAEVEMTPAFNPALSRKLDFLLVLEQHEAEADDERA